MKTKKYIILLFLMLFASLLQAQVSEYEYKAAFVERFTRFVDWPNKSDGDIFKIVVFGENPFDNTLNELFDKTKIKSKYVKIIYTYKLEDLAIADLVFISDSEKKQVKDIIAITNKYSILTIGDSKGFCSKGVHINMYVEGNYIRYEINQKEIEKSQLRISSLLLNSAKIITTDD